jgi:hypothetical protein
LDFATPAAAAGVGVVSYLHRGAFLPQGTPAARILVETEGKESYSYSVVAGRDTADVWWQYADPWQRKHRLAPVFKSWKVNAGGKRFQAHEYYAVFSFPRPLAVKKLKFRNSSQKSGWRISDIVLIR